MKYWIAFIGVLLSLVLQGQSIVINDDFTSAYIRNQSFVHNDSSALKPIEDVIQLPSSQWELLPLHGLSSLHSSHAYWIKFSVLNVSDKECLLEMDYALNDEVTLYRIVDEKVKYLGDMGDEFSSDNRIYQYRNPLYKLDLPFNKEVFYYLRVKKKRSTVYAPLIIYEQKSFINTIAYHELLNGILIGSFILFLTFSIITSIALRSKIYALFSLHVMTFMIYILNSSGIGYLYIWSNFLNLTNYMGYLFAFFSIVALSLLYNYYFDLSQKYPFQHKVIIWSLRIYTIIAIIATIGYSSFEYNIFLYVIRIAHFSILLIPIILIILSFQYYRKFRNGDTIFFLLAFSISLTGFLLLPLRPVIQLSPISYIVFRYLLSIECLLLFIMLFKDLYDSKIEQISLQKRLITHKKESIDSYLQGQLKERKRISMNLHDSVGIKLANLKLKLSNHQSGIKKNDVIESVDNLSNIIRSISHELNPIALERKGLIAAIENDICKIEAVNDQVDIDFRYVDNMNTLDHKASEHIYWVFLELVNNALKHAEASELYIELYSKDDAVHLVVEDNGIGYDSTKTFDKGIGLYNIHNRANLIDGQFLTEKKEHGIKHLFVVPAD